MIISLRVMPLAGLLAAVLAVTTYSQNCDDLANFKRETLIPGSGLNEPMEIDIDAAGNVYWVERVTGKVAVWNAQTKASTTLITIPTYRTINARNSLGLLGITLAPDFASTGHLYLTYTPSGQSGMTGNTRVSRFTVANNAIAASSEVKIIDFATNFRCCHQAGSIKFGPDGVLYISTGDNYGEDGGDYTSSFGTSLNPQDYNGKVLRVIPKASGGYDIPAGNMFASASEGKPEIFVAGARNPYRISVDPRTSWLYFGDIGPDQARMEEVNQVRRERANFGWPAYFGNNENTPGAGGYNAVKDKWPVPAKPALLSWVASGGKFLTSATQTQSSSAITGTAAMSGPVYYYDGQSPSKNKLPPSYHGSLFIYEFDNGWIRSVRFNEAGYVKSVENFTSFSWNHMIDMEVSPQGELHVLDYGAAYRTNNGNDGLYKISYQPADPTACLPRRPELDNAGTIGNAERFDKSTFVRNSAGPARADFLRRIDGKVFVDAKGLASGEAVVLALDGRELARFPVQGGRLTPITGVSPGLYFIRLKTANGVWEQKTLL